MGPLRPFEARAASPRTGAALASSNWRSKSSKKRTNHTKAPRPDNRQPKGSGPHAGPKTQQKGKHGGGRGMGGKGPQGLTFSLGC